MKNENALQEEQKIRTQGGEFICESQVNEYLINKLSGKYNINELDGRKSILHYLICEDLTAYFSDESEVEKFRYDAICKILNSKADTRIKDCMGRTPLHYAVMKRKSMIVLRLLAQDDRSAFEKDNDNCLPIDYFDPNSGDEHWDVFYHLFGKMTNVNRKEFIESINEEAWAKPYVISQIIRLCKHKKYAFEIRGVLNDLLNKLQSLQHNK